ncbi:MAG: NfeD family protein [Rhodocyclaceae bacterium]
MWWVLGFALIAAELLVPSFFIIWFGVAALLVGLLVWIASVGLAVQIVAWAALSIVLVVLWFKVFKQRTVSSAGTADAALGEVGMLIHDVRPFHPGKVRFQRPILGSDVWECVAEEDIRTGERVRVVAVEGRALRVSSAATRGA